MYCTRCGVKNHDGANFCGACGAPMIPPPQNYVPMQPNEAAAPQNCAPAQPAETAGAVIASNAVAWESDAPKETLERACNYSEPAQPTEPWYVSAPPEGYYCQPYYQSYDPSQPNYSYCAQPYAPAKKKKTWLLIPLAVAVVAAIALIVIFLFGNSAGYDSPEDAALIFFKATNTGDWDACESAMHPDMVTSELKELFDEEVIEEIRTQGLKGKNFAVDEVSDFTELEYVATKINHKFNLRVTDAKIVKIKYDRYINGYFDGPEWIGLDANILVVEIDGDWYAVPDVLD